MEQRIKAMKEICNITYYLILKLKKKIYFKPICHHNILGKNVLF